MERKIKRFIRMNKTLVIYTTVFLVGCIGLFVGLIPSVQKAIALYQEVKSLQTEVNKIQEKAAMLSSIDQGALEQTVQEVLVAVPSDKSVTTLMASVEGVAQKHNLAITDLNIEGIGSIASGSAKQATKPEGNSLTEIVTLQGELSQFRNFLADVIHVRRLMRVKSMELTAIPKSTMMNMKLSVEVFYAPLPSSIGKATDTLKPYSANELQTLEKLAGYPIIYASSIGVMTPVAAAPVNREAPTAPVLSDPFSTGNASNRAPRPTATPGVTESPAASTVPPVSPSPTRTATPSARVSPTVRPSSSPTP